MAVYFSLLYIINSYYITLASHSVCTMLRWGNVAAKKPMDIVNIK